MRTKRPLESNAVAPTGGASFWDAYAEATGSPRRGDRKQLPLLPGEVRGTLHLVYRRCGKPTCRCASAGPDEKGKKHPALYHHFRDESGKRVRRYVPTKGKKAQAELARLREGIEKRQAREARRPQLRQVRRTVRALRREGQPVPIQLRAIHELLKRREAKAQREAKQHEQWDRQSMTQADMIAELTEAMGRGEWP
jgi:hypothetical protein